MRTLGANRIFLRTTQLIEFNLLGLISGVLARVISEIMLYALYTQIMHIEYRANFYLWIMVPVIGTVFVGLAGCWEVRNGGQ